MDFVSPTEWGAAVNYDDWSDTQYKKDLIAVHWGGPPPAGFDEGYARECEILRAYEDYHLNTKGWRGIAYGYAIGASGTVYRLRGKNNYGAHQGDYDGDSVSNNKEVVPVLFIMGQGQHATQEMWASLIQLRLWLMEQPWTEDNLPVTGHRVIQPKPTSCPGDANMAIIEAANWNWVPPPPEPQYWQKPGDPVLTDEDADNVFAYLSLQGTSNKIKDAWALDALMRHDVRLNTLEERI